MNISTIRLNIKFYHLRIPLAAMVFCLMSAIGFARDYNILDYGAKADGVTKDTKTIQKTIDECSQAGGGRVIIPAGRTAVTGTLFLKSYVTLYLENGSVLAGSTDMEDYASGTHKNMYKNETHMDRCIVFARDAASIAIEGHGTIDGRGHTEYFNGSTIRPMLIRFMNCKNLRVRDVKLLNPAAWTSAWLYCDDIVVDGISISSRANKNGDGLDFDGCTNVRVSNCTFDTSDDSICLQTSLPDKPCRDVVVTNCTFTSKWAGMRIGLLSRGDFESVTVTNCTFRDIDDSGLKIQMNEGGTMKDMVFSNLVMQNVPRPVFMTFCQQRACTDAPEAMYPMKSMKQFVFSNFIIDNSGLDKNSAILITGMPGHDIEDILLKDIRFTVAGGGTLEDAQKTDINEYTLEVLKGHWPEFYGVGTLPASAIYLRHVSGIALQNIDIAEASADKRPAVVLDDVKNHRQSDLFRNGSALKESDIKIIR